MDNQTKIKTHHRTLCYWVPDILAWLKTVFSYQAIIFLLVAYSILVIGLMHSNELLSDVYYLEILKIEGYASKINWLFFPVWWLFLAALVHLSWRPFMHAWGDMHQKEMLRNSRDKPATVEQLTNLCKRMECYRVIWLLVAGLLSLGLNYLDTSDLRKIYNACGEESNHIEILFNNAGLNESTRLCRAALEFGQGDEEMLCRPFKKEIEKGTFNGKFDKSDSENCKRVARDLDGVELDFTIAYLAIGESESDETREARKKGNILLNYAAYFQQFVAGWMGLFALFQLGLLCYVFWRLESSRSINRDKLKIRLDPFSRVNEFGLEKWNHALNNVYWIFAVALVIPFVSRQVQPTQGLDIGQLILQIGVPILIALPMVATIIARQQRVQDLWSIVKNEEDPRQLERYYQQRLWPLDKNWASKLGIVISFVMLSYLLGTNLLKLAG